MKYKIDPEPTDWYVLLIWILIILTIAVMNSF